MALSTPTLLDNATAVSANLESLATAAITPTGGALLVVCVTALDAGGEPFTLGISDTFTGTGSWTQATDGQDTGNRYVRTSIFYATAGATPGEGTITVTSTPTSTNPDRWVMHTVEITGHNASTPVSQDDSTINQASSLTVTLDSTPATTSMVLGMVGSLSDTGGITEGTDFTEIADSDISNHAGQSQYNLGDADTTCDWSSLTDQNNVGVAIEIAEAGGEAPNTRRYSLATLNVG